jgi:hypothetical protein
MRNEELNSNYTFPFKQGDRVQCKGISYPQWKGMRGLVKHVMEGNPSMFVVLNGTNLLLDKMDFTKVVEEGK